MPRQRNRRPAKRPAQSAQPTLGSQFGGVGHAFAYTWAADGRHVYTVVSSDTVPFQTMWSVPLDGTPPRPLVLFDDPLTTFGRGSFAKATRDLARGSRTFAGKIPRSARDDSSARDQRRG